MLEPRVYVNEYSFLKTIDYLNLNYNLIGDVPEIFKKLSNLKELHLKRNNLCDRMPWLTQLRKLERIDLSENNLKFVPNAIYELPKLEYANLSNNKITQFNVTCENKNLQYLFLNDNEITAVPVTIEFLKDLRHLALDCNKIVELNENVFKNLSHEKCRISLSGNLMKNKDYYNNFMDKDIITIINGKLNYNSETKNIMENLTVEEEVNKIKEEKVNLQNTVEYNEAQHYIEKEVNELILARVIEIENNLTAEEKNEKKLEIKEQVLTKVLEDMIKSKQVSELSRFNDKSLIYDMKKIYKKVILSDKEQVENSTNSTRTEGFNKDIDNFVFVNKLSS